jgi:hypothetical protein
MKLGGDRKTCLLTALFLIFAVAGILRADNVPANISYDLHARIEPAAGDVAVRGKVEFDRPDAASFQFNLHETFTIQSLRVSGKPANYTFSTPEFSPFTPAARRVTVALPSDTPPGRVEMEIEYAGRLKKLPEFGADAEGAPSMDDQVNAHLVELAGFSCWYPQFSFGGAPIKAEFEVSLPQGWIAVGSGEKRAERAEAGRSLTHWLSPRDLDLLLVASPDFRKKTVRESGVNIEIYDTRMPEAFINGEGQQIARVVKLYISRLGETTIPGETVRHVYSPKRHGQGKAGSARPGLIVTSEGVTLDSLAADPHFSLFQPIAHEIAHFWWNSGTGQGDWINEASAEYFSAVVVQQILSEKEFQAVLADYRQQVKALPADAPPLATVPFVNDEVRYVVRYFKGALMLDFLRATVGDEAFFSSCREFFQTYREKSVGTPEFRSFWKAKLAGKGNLVDLWLDSRGGLPKVE